MSKAQIISIIVIGNQSVGKSSLSRRFCEGRFQECYLATIGIDCLNKTINRKEGRVELKIWDSAGSDKFQTFTSQFIRRAQAALLVFDLTDKKSFDNISNLSNMLLDVKNFPMVLVGNKCDIKEEQQVNIVDVEKFASDNHLKFFETSAKTGKNVNACFLELVDIYFNDKQKIQVFEIPSMSLEHNQKKGNNKKKRRC